MMADSGYRDLADAIILQAVTDYRRAHWKTAPVQSSHRSAGNQNGV